MHSFPYCLVESPIGEEQHIKYILVVVYFRQNIPAHSLTTQLLQHSVLLQSILPLVIANLTPILSVPSSSFNPGYLTMVQNTADRIQHLLEQVYLGSHIWLLFT